MRTNTLPCPHVVGNRTTDQTHTRTHAHWKIRLVSRRPFFGRAWNTRTGAVENTRQITHGSCARIHLTLQSPTPFPSPCNLQRVEEEVKQSVLFKKKKQKKHKNTTSSRPCNGYWSIKRWHLCSRFLFTDLLRLEAETRACQHFCTSFIAHIQTLDASRFSEGEKKVVVYFLIADLSLSSRNKALRRDGFFWQMCFLFFEREVKIRAKTRT